MDGFGFGAAFATMLFFVVLGITVLSVLGGFVMEVATIVIGIVVTALLLHLAASR